MPATIVQQKPYQAVNTTHIIVADSAMTNGNNAILVGTAESQSLSGSSTFNGSNMTADFQQFGLFRIARLLVASGGTNCVTTSASSDQFRAVLFEVSGLTASPFEASISNANSGEGTATSHTLEFASGDADRCFFALITPGTGTTVTGNGGAVVYPCGGNRFVVFKDNIGASAGAVSITLGTSTSVSYFGTTYLTGGTAASTAAGAATAAAGAATVSAQSAAVSAASALTAAGAASVSAQGAASAASVATAADGVAAVNAVGSATAQTEFVPAQGLASVSAVSGAGVVSSADAVAATGAATVSAIGSGIAASSATAAAGEAAASAVGRAMVSAVPTAAAGLATVAATGASSAVASAVPAAGVATVSGTAAVLGIVAAAAVPAEGQAIVSAVGSFIDANPDELYPLAGTTQEWPLAGTTQTWPLSEIGRG